MSGFVFASFRVPGRLQVCFWRFAFKVTSRGCYDISDVPLARCIRNSSGGHFCGTLTCFVLQYSIEQNIQCVRPLELC